jgi:hypothetical protein
MNRGSEFSAVSEKTAASPFIDTAIIHFLLEAVDPLYLPPFKGSTLRGALGHALHRIACKTRAADCGGCSYTEDCDYSYIFNTPPPPGSTKMKKAEAAPHPFVIEPPLEEKQIYPPGDRLAFSLILIGRGIELADLFIEAIRLMGEQGLGKKQQSRGRVRVLSARNGTFKNSFSFNPPIDSDAPQNISEYFALTFVTPARFCIDKNPIMPNEFDFSIFFRHLIRRISLIDYFHGNGDAANWDVANLFLAADQVNIVQNDLEWADWERYSSFQEKRMAFGGIRGNVVFTGNTKSLMPLIRAGQLFHVGKNTTFGLGKYLLS